MKKKILMGIEVIVTFLFFLNVFHVAAAVVTSGNYSYEVLTDGTIRITSYNGNEKNVVVPATLDGKKVSRIRTLAFANKTELTTVTFSEGIENVEAYAFDNCTNLEKVTFPSTMLYISDLFYKKTPKITFHIPEGMERVESGEYLKLDHVTVHGVFEYDLAREVVEETNKHRKANGLNTLQIDNELMEAAMHRAAENAVYYNHIRPNGLDCFTILEHKIIKENIYASTMITNGAGMVTKWKNSGMHNQAMLFKDNVSIGVGVFYVNGVTYAVQLFSDDNSDDTSTKNEKIENSTTAITLINKDEHHFHIDFVIIKLFPENNQIIRRNNKIETPSKNEFTWNELPQLNQAYIKFNNLSHIEKRDLIENYIIPVKCKEKRKDDNDETKISSAQVFVREVNNYGGIKKKNR